MLQFSPNLVAGGTILPYRVVKMDTTAFQGVASTAAADFVVGVTDGSTRRFDSANHAEVVNGVGDPISLQPSNCVQLTASASITAGQGLIPTTAGKVVAVSGSGNVAHFVALEGAGADGQIFWAYRLPSTKAV
jgi:hypothetical protein